MSNDNAPGSSNSPANQELRSLIASLVSQIQVPSRGSSLNIGDQSINEEELRRVTRQTYNTLRSDPQNVRSLKLNFPHVAAAFQEAPDDYERFHKVYRDAHVDLRRKIALMTDETSVEGQQYIAERIRIQTIEDQYAYAMEHLPEAFLPIALLHIHIKINGVEVLAMIDSGAQTSVISAEIAKKLNLYDFIDERFHTNARGVGGSSKVRGRIHACKVQVGTAHTTVPLDVLDERRVELLLGLNFLRPNGCIIDLKRNVLIMHDAETAFLGEQEYKREVERLGHIAIGSDEKPSSSTAPPPPSPSVAPSGSPAASPQPEIDSEKLAQLMSMGLDGDKAIEALRLFNNDFHRALQHLLNELDDDTPPQP